MDLADLAQAREQLDIDMAMRAHRQRVREAQAAGNGICLDCGEPIDPRRLAVNPGAVRCTECQGSEELRGFQRFGRAA